MRRIHQIISRAAVVAAAGLVALSLSAQSAKATTLYTTDFSGFSTGDINTQSGGTPTKTWSQTVSTNTAANVIAGPALQIARTGTTGLTEVAPVFSPNVSLVGNTITVSTTVNVITPSTGNPADVDGPFFGITLVGSGGAPALGSFGIDALSGSLLFDTGDFSFNATTGAGPTGLSGPQTISFSVTDTGSQDVLNAYLGNTLEYSATSSNFASSFYAGFLGGFTDEPGQPGNDAGDATANFTSYSVSESVPEPASLSLLGVALIGFCGRRGRRNAVLAR
jgi:hypothetical protein